MSHRKVKVGFIGLGHNGLGHIEAHLRQEKSQIVALCDRNEERLETAGKKFGISRRYRDDSFFEDPEIEAVSIHTGDNQHREPFLLALQHGKHVLIEKPLANTEEDVAAMVQEARRVGPSLKIQVGYILRFNPVFEEIHRLARLGALGQIYYLEGDYFHNLLYQREQTDPVTGHNWYLEHERPMVGGGSHPLDLLRWISGKEIVRVTGFGSHVAFPEMIHDDCQAALFQFEDGTVAKVSALYAPRREMIPYYNLRVYGTLGTVERDEIALAKREDEVHPSLVPVLADRVAGHAYDIEILDWLDAIREDRLTRINLFDGANSTMATLCACRAIQERRTIEVPVFHT